MRLKRTFVYKNEVQEKVMKGVTQNQTIAYARKFAGKLLYRNVLLLMVLILSACGGESKQDYRQATVSFSLGYGALAHDTLNSIIVTVRDTDGTYLTSGDILPSRSLTLSVPANVAMNVEAVGYQGSLALYSGNTGVPALWPGQNYPAALSMSLIPGGAKPDPVVTPGNGATGIPVISDFMVDATALGTEIQQIDSASLTLTPNSEAPVISTVFNQPEAGFSLLFTLPSGTSLQANTRYFAQYQLTYTHTDGSSQSQQFSWAFVTGDSVNLDAITDTTLRSCVEANLAAGATVFDLLNLNCRNRYISSMDGLEQFTNLQRLDMSNANLNDLTPIRNLTNLTALYLSECGECGNNRFSDLTPLSELVNLTELDLSMTRVQDLTGLENLASLDRLWLSGNSVSDISPLRNLTSLTELYLESNQIVDISWLQDLTNLQILELQFNQVVNIASLQGMSSLQTLGLRANQVVDISAISSLPNLVFLDLYSNRIRQVSLSGMAGLEILDLGFNRIQTLSLTGDMPALTHLWAQNNYITSISFTGSFPLLGIIDLYANNIKDVSAFSSLAALSTLGLSNNIVENVASLAGLSSLRYLDLSNNNVMSGVDQFNSETTPNILSISLNGNSALSCATLAGLDSSLDQGNGSVNGVVRWNYCFGEPLVANLVFPNTASGTALRTCVNNLDVLNVTDVTQLACSGVTDLTGIEQLPFLTNLSLSNNAIVDFAPLSRLTNLQQLNLDSTGLTRTSYLGTLKNLNRLSIGDNPFGVLASTSIDIENLVSLTHLSVWGNQLTATSGIGLLDTLVNAQVIDLACMGTSDELTALDNALDAGNGAYSGIVLWGCT
ncbi:MAG: leucine-rich repeat domain-containing protein [Gammaproteobacteria bacterium]|nr:leucine-rich repeat domain-containing protein [Gammaproteobacteria bacterium]